MPSPRGQKREASEEANDEERAARGKEDKRGTKRKDEVQDDSAREQDRDMSSLQQANRKHPGPVQHKFDKGELEWRHVGSGEFARTFPMAQRFVTTTKSGPPMCEVHRRVM